MKYSVYCPQCAAAGIRRKLMEVDSHAKGIIYPYCKGCKANIKIELQCKVACRHCQDASSLAPTRSELIR